MASSVDEVVPPTHILSGRQLCVRLFLLSLSLSVVARQLIKICGRCFIIFRVDTLIQFKFDASRGRHIIDLNYICMLCGRLALSRSLPFLYRLLHLCVAHTSCRALPCFDGRLWLCLRIDCLKLQSLKRHLLSRTHAQTHTQTHAHLF